MIFSTSIAWELPKNRCEPCETCEPLESLENSEVTSCEATVSAVSDECPSHKPHKPLTENFGENPNDIGAHKTHRTHKPKRDEPRAHEELCAQPKTASTVTETWDCSCSFDSFAADKPLVRLAKVAHAYLVHDQRMDCFEVARIIRERGGFEPFYFWRNPGLAIDLAVERGWHFNSTPR